MKLRVCCFFGWVFALSITCCFAELPAYFQEKGTIQSGRYVAPGLFSISLPPLRGEPHISERVLRDSKEIVVTDQQSTFFRMTYVQMPEELQKGMIENKILTEQKELLYPLFRSMFDEVTLPYYQTQFAGAKVLQRKEFKLAGEKPALLVLIKLPKESFAREGSMGTKDDVLFSVLLFPIETNILILHYQAETSERSAQKEQVKLLLKIANSCKAEPCTSPGRLCKSRDPIAAIK